MAIRDVIANFRLRDRSQQDVETIQSNLTRAFTGFGFRGILAGLGAEIAGAITEGFRQGIERVDDLRQQIRHQTGLPDATTDPIGISLLSEGLSAESVSEGIFASRRFQGAYDTQAEQLDLTRSLSRLSEFGVNLDDFSQFSRQFLGPNATTDQLTGLAEYGYAVSNVQGTDPARLFGQANASSAELLSLGLDPLQALEFTADVDRSGINLSSIRLGLGHASRAASEADVPFLDYARFAQDQIRNADPNAVAGLGAQFFGSRGNAGVRIAQAIYGGEVGFQPDELLNENILGSQGLDIFQPTRRQSFEAELDAANLQGGVPGGAATAVRGIREIPLAGDVVDLFGLQTTNTDVSRGTTVGSNAYVVNNFNISAGETELSDETKERIAAVVRDEIQSGNIRIPRSY